MYLPLDVNVKDDHKIDWERNLMATDILHDAAFESAEDVALKLKYLLEDAGVPPIDERLIVQDLLSDNNMLDIKKNANISNIKPYTFDLSQSENDFIDAYNALTKSNPLPNIVIDKIAKSTRDFNTDKTRNAELSTNNINHAATNSSSNVTDTKNIKTMEQDYSTEAEMIQQPIFYLKSHTGSDISTENKYNDKLTSEIENLSTTDVQMVTNSLSKEQQIQSALSLDSEKLADVNNTTQRISADDKAKNLNDIVDNTQRLIQQMKEEINSDINSLDGRNISQSEFESSSNDEHESTYSDTEGHSDSFTEEDEAASSDNCDKKPSSIEPIRSNISNRTSSEDNEQFEEAIDHMDSQIDEFKSTNIELLNSIARSLQEEHTISIIPESIESNVNKQDLNNNMYVEVNTFEEIYAELNSDIINKNDITITPLSIQENKIPTISEKLATGNSQPADLDDITTVKEVKLKLSKQVMRLIEYKIRNPSRLNFMNKMEPKYTAKSGFIEVKESDESFVEDSNSNGTANNNINSDSDNNSDASLRSVGVKVQMNDINQDSDLTLTDSEKSRSTSPSHLISDQTPDTVDEKVEITLTTTINTATEDNTQSLEHLKTGQTLIENIKETTTKKTETTDLNQINDTSMVEAIILPETPNESNINKNSSNKSHIPKFIKNALNAKPKADKLAPKLLISKVPVRRISIKQYPAPAPPKTHFGTVQNGHVKQLQTKLFNGKASKIPNISSGTTEPKPSTSTLSKKKTAPPPPTALSSPLQNLSPEKLTQKSQYFRETCRTEDEWTESDNEESPPNINKEKVEQETLPPSPPPPVTLRRVSGQLIDLATVRLPEGSPEV